MCKFFLLNFFCGAGMQKFKSVDELIHQLKPKSPVYCIRRDSINLASKFFQNKFPGKILYAIKTNPHLEAVSYTHLTLPTKA